MFQVSYFICKNAYENHFYKNRSNSVYPKEAYHVWSIKLWKAYLKCYLPITTYKK